jgi:hypothetical protein
MFMARSADLLWPTSLRNRRLKREDIQAAGWIVWLAQYQQIPFVVVVKVCGSDERDRHPPRITALCRPVVTGAQLARTLPQ